MYLRNNNFLYTSYEIIGRVGMVQWRNVGGSRDCAMVRAVISHQHGPGSIPRIGIMWVEFVTLALVLVRRGFSLATLVFPCPKKTTFLNSNSIWIVSPYCKAHLLYDFDHLIMELCTIQIYY